MTAENRLKVGFYPVLSCPDDRHLTKSPNLSARYSEFDSLEGRKSSANRKSRPLCNFQSCGYAPSAADISFCYAVMRLIITQKGSRC
jgi:hypothetical protein